MAMSDPTFQEWLDQGVALGYCTPQVCATHAGIPSTDHEDELFDEGDDPCQHIVRLGTKEDWHG